MSRQLELREEPRGRSQADETDEELARRWVESQRNSYRHRLPLDPGLTIAVIDRLGLYERARCQRMLEVLWQHAHDDFERELVLDVFHESTGPCFHPDYIAEELAWINDVLRDAPEHMQAYWQKLDADRPAQTKWEQRAREMAASFPPDEENIPYIQQTLLSMGIDPERLAEFWPSSDYVPYTPEESAELERFLEENHRRLLEGNQGPF